MDSHTNSLDLVVSALSKGATDENVLLQLDALAKSSESARKAVDALVAHHLSSGAGSTAAVSRTMQILEKLAQEAEVRACILMVYLWEYANELYMHDICDAIDIWLYNCESAELNPHLSSRASSHDDGVRKHFEQLIGNKKKNKK